MASIKMRQDVERRIVSAFVKQALAAGYRLSVSLDRGYDLADGSPFLGATDATAIIAETLAGDAAHVFLHAADGPLLIGSKLNAIGWVYFVFGNDGWDAISDYTTNLDKLEVLTDAEAISRRYEG
jgi:hypothetical protein